MARLYLNSVHTVPSLSLSKLGNMVAREDYRLSSFNSICYKLIFDDIYMLLEGLYSIGETNFIAERRQKKAKDTYLAALAIFKALNNKKTYGFGVIRSIRGHSGKRQTGGS